MLLGHVNAVAHGNDALAGKHHWKTASPDQLPAAAAAASHDGCAQCGHAAPAGDLAYGSACEAAPAAHGTDAACLLGRAAQPVVLLICPARHAQDVLAGCVEQLAVGLCGMLLSASGAPAELAIAADGWDLQQMGMARFCLASSSDCPTGVTW